MTTTVVESPTLTAALSYAARGWHVLPVAPRSKRPILSAWQEAASTDPAVIRGWFASGQNNVGVQLGPRSGIIDVEADDEQGQQEIAEVLGSIRTPTLIGNRGPHYILKFSGGLPGGAVLHVGRMEIRTGNGNRGAQTVFPPSTHPTGASYRWIISPEEAEPAEIPQKLAALLWNAQGEPDLQIGRRRLSDREIALDALAGLNPSRAVAYDDWLRVGQMLHSVETDLLPHWQDWSQRCPEKYDADQCSKKWISFNGDGGLTLGSLLYLARQDGWQPVWERNGHAKPQQVIEPSNGQAKRQPIDLRPMTLKALMAADICIDYLVPNLIAAAQPILLAGPVKSLKTSLLLDLSLAITTAGCFLGRFRVPHAVPVGVITCESGLPVVKDTFQRQSRAARIHPENVSNLIISDRIPHLANPAYLDAIGRLIDDYGLKLLAIDPAYLCLDGADAGNLMLFGQQLRGVSELCQDRGVALLLCHHVRKGAGQDGQPVQLTDAAWSGFAEYFRQWLLVNNREPYDHSTGTHRLWLSAGGSAGHGGLWAVDVRQGHITDPEGRVWEVKVSDVDQAADAAKQRQQEARIVDQQVRLDADKSRLRAAMLHQRFAEGGTPADLRAAVAMSGGRFNVVIQALLDDGLVEAYEVKKGNRQTPYPGFRLVQSADSQAADIPGFESDSEATQW